MSNLLSDNHKIETIKFGRKKQSTISSKNVESLFISLTSRYFEGIKKQIQDLIINSNGKDLNVGKIVAPALKVLWLEGLHEGLFYDRKKNIEYSSSSSVIEFASREENARLRKIEIIKDLRQSTLTKDERAILNAYDNSSKLEQLQAVGSDNALLKQALAKRNYRKSKAKELQEVDKILEGTLSRGSLVDYENPNQVLQRFDQLKTKKDKLRYYDNLSPENRKIVKAYVEQTTPDSSFREIKDYTVTGEKAVKSKERRRELRGYKIDSNERLTEERIEARSRAAIKPTQNRSEQEVDAILNNPSLSKKEKRQALNRLIGPDSNRRFKLRNRDEVVRVVQEERLSTQIRVPTRETKTTLKSLLNKKSGMRDTRSKTSMLGYSLDVDVRERIRDIETYYPYLANTEERLSDVQAYIDSRTIELSNYYTEEFKDNLKTQIAEITKDSKGDLGKTKIALKRLFDDIEGKRNPEKEEKYNKLADKFDREFVKVSTKPSVRQLNAEQLAYEKAERKLRKQWLGLDKNKKPYAELNRLKEIYDSYKIGDLNETNNSLIRKYVEQRKTKQEILDIISRAIKAKEKTLNSALREYLGDSDEAREARNKLKEQRIGRKRIKISDLDKELQNQLVAEGVIGENQKYISTKGFNQIKQRLRNKAKEKDNYAGVNPIITEQYESLKEARRLARKEAIKNKENPSLYLDKYYRQVHEERLGRKLTKDDFPPDNINNLIVNPFNRLERIINNELTTSYNLGRIEAFIRNGVKQVRWISTLDTKTSTFCMSLNNRIFNLTEIQAFATGRGLLYPYFPNTKKTFDEVKRNSAIGVFYLPSVHPYCRSYLEPIPPQEELESEKKNFFSTYQQVLSEQLAANKISPESLVNNDRLLQAMVVMGAVGLNIKARGDRRKREEERRRRLIAAGSVLATGVGLYAIARSRVGQQLYDNAVDALQRGRRVVPDDNLVQDFVEASSRAVDDTIEEITDVSPNTLVSSIEDIVESRPPLALPPAKDVTDIPTPSQRLVELPENLDPELEAVLREPSFRPAIEAVRNFDDDLPVNPTVVDRPPLSISPRQAQRIEDILKNTRDITEDNISDIEEASTVVGKIEAYIKARTGKTPEGRQSLDVTLLQDLIQINDRTSSQIITNVLRYQARDIQNVSDNIDLMLSKAFKGRLPNTNNITEVRIVDKANKLYRVKQNGKYSLINSELEPTVISNYISELKAKRRQLNQNLSRAKTKETQVRLKNLLKEYEASISKLEKLFGSPLPSNRNSQLTQKQLKPIQSRIDTANKLYQELDEMNLTIRTKRGRVVQVDAKSVIGNAGQRAISFRTFLKTIDSPNIVSSSNVPLSNSLREKLKERYTKFFFRESQIRGLALRYRGSLREDFELFVSRPNLTSADIDLKVEQLEQLKIYIEQQIRTKGNSVLSDYDIFVQELDNASRIFPKLSRSPNVTTNERKFFTDNINLYINDVTRDIDNQIAMIRDMK